MSQAKVDKYKEYKKNKKQILEKEKRKKKAVAFSVTGVAVLFLVVVVAVFGIMINDRVQKYLNSRPVFNYVAEELIVNDYAGLLQEETTAEDDENNEASDDM